MDEGLARSYFIVLQDWFCRGHEILFSQHEYPANPEVGDGLRKILKSLNFTRIGARALPNELRREYGVDDISKEKDHRPIRADSYGRSDHPPLKLILEQLEERVPVETEKAIESAKRLRTNIESLPENSRYKLLDSLQKKHVSTMWTIAGYNSFDCAADMLPSLVERKPPVGVKGKPPVGNWKGKIHRIFWNLPSPRMGYIFGNDGFKMRFSLDNNGSVYGEIIRGMKGLYYLIPKDATGDSLHKKPLDLTFEYRNGDQQLAESPQIRTNVTKIGKILNRRKNRVGPSDDNVNRGNPYVKSAERPKLFMDKYFRIRCAGPNVLVGQARREDGFSSGEIVLIKIC